jgi:hypothetical protein
MNLFHAMKLAEDLAALAKTSASRAEYRQLAEELRAAYRAQGSKANVSA